MMNGKEESVALTFKRERLRLRLNIVNQNSPERWFSPTSFCRLEPPPEMAQKAPVPPIPLGPVYCSVGGRRGSWAQKDEQVFNRQRSVKAAGP